MFLSIDNSPMAYDWGSENAIAELLGRPSSGAPEAELWFGSHPASPSRLIRLDTDTDSEPQSLADWIKNNQDLALGSATELSFLLKLLAAKFPLSLQAHPNRDQAAAGFARENELGLPITHPTRNYRDPFPKPELLLALSEEFEVLCGFRPLDRAIRAFEEVGLSGLADRLEDLPSFFEWLLSGDPEVFRALELAVETSKSATQAPDRDTVLRLHERFPGDAGILCALLLNRETLRRGEAIYLPAGNIHAYLSGVGIELMASSDNVLRGGLTSKHVDAHELLRILDFSRSPLERLEPRDLNGAKIFEPEGSNLQLVWAKSSCRVAESGPRIAFCTTGRFELIGSQGTAYLSRGEAVFVTPDEGELEVIGSGDLFIAAGV